MALGDGTSWNESNPNDNSSAREGDDEIRDLRIGSRIRLEKEHEDFGNSSAGGEHLAGSAKAYYQATAPTLRPDGTTTLTAADNGRIYVDSDDNKAYVYVHGTGFVQIVGSIPDGTITNAMVNASAAIVYSKLSIADADLTIAKTNGLQTALDAKATKAYAYTETKEVAYTATVVFTHNLGYIPMHIVVGTASNDNPPPHTVAVSTTTISVFNPSTTENVTVYAW